MNTINLDNDYFLEIKNANISNIDITTDITNLRLHQIKKKKILLLKIDFNTFQEKNYKKILRKLLSIKNFLLLTHTKIGLLKDSKKCIGYLVNYDKNNKKHNDFILGINAILYKTRYERYNYIYDTACDYLDSFFYGKNLCDFKDNKCGEKRNTSSTIGCCRHYKVKWLGPLTKFVKCEHLTENYTCGAKCIGCKLFTCDYLEKKGIKFRIRDILLLNVFFNPIQKYFIRYMVFTPKEKVLKTLMFF